MPPSPKLSTHTTRYSPTATSAARITLTRVLESKIGQMPLVLLQYLVPDLHYCQSSVENFMTNLREAKKQGRASAGSKLEEWEGFYSGWSRYVGKVERALELKEKVSNQTFPAPKQTFSDPLFTLPSGSSSLRASEAILAEYFGRLWADWQNYQVDEEDDDDEEDEDQSYSDWKELGKEYGSKTLGEGDENVRRALRLVVDATDLLRSPTDGKQAIGTLRSALYWSKGVPVSLTTSRLFRVAGGTLASHFQNGIASEMVLEWEASRLGPVQRRIDNLVLPSARPIDSPPLSDSVRKTFGTTTAQEGAADAVLNSVYALMDPSSSTDDTVVAHHDLAAVYDLDAIQKGGSEAVAETLDEFGTFEERKKLFRLSRRLAGIEGRSGLPGERSFSPLLSTDNILIFRVMMAQAAGIVDSQTLAVVQDHLDEILLMTNAAIMSSSPSVYSLIAASKLFLVYRHIVFDHTASPSYAATKELVEELIALSSSLFVTATVCFHPVNQKDPYAATVRSWDRALREAGYTCDHGGCDVPLEMVAGRLAEGESELVTLQPGSKAREMRSGGGWWRLASDSLGWGTRKTRYPCPDCLHRFGDNGELHAVAILVRRLLHRRCRYHEGRGGPKAT